MIDGGIRCGADVVKAIALGAKAVGLGRPFLYANGTHGEEGVRRVMESRFSTTFAAIQVVADNRISSPRRNHEHDAQYRRKHD